MKKFLNFKTAAFLAAVHFLILCYVVDYRFDRVKSFNWDIALMLTPWGISQNLLIEADHYLAPYYFKVIQLPEGHSFVPVVYFIILQVILSMTALYFFKKQRQK